MGKKINDMFSKIHNGYDLANRIYSAGTDASWRRDAARDAMIQRRSFRVLDIATGTGELAIDVANAAKSLGKDVTIVGLDLNKQMMDTGRSKVDKKGIGNITFKLGNAESLPFASASFDIATSAFLLRNLDNQDKFCSELHRVLKKGGKFVLLDMALPESILDRIIYELYFGVLMYPVSFLANREAYKWLRQSLATFDKKRFVSMLKSNHFRNIKVRPLTLGVGYVITGTK